MEKYASKPANSGGMKMSDGDWVCSDFDCGNVNFSRRTSCNRCGKERAELKLKKKMGTEIGKSAADKSRGLFSADDWQCNKCANVNWARRQTCNVCNAPKFGEVEARTGYGGGYNERGTVEYRPRRDSDDDEYDEFGRRKKKKNNDQPDKVMSIQRARSLSASSQRGDISTQQHAAYKKPTALFEDVMLPIPKNSERSLDIRSADHLRESRYSRSSENSTEMLRRTGNVAPPTRQGRRRRESDLAGGPSMKSNVSSPRDCIMENRVSSTNEIKYRFTGKSIDENFEVVYTLEERVCAAAWAITYMNCRMSAEQFQNTFDKPAPDFKTVFAWRQRLLATGCLLDNHVLVESPQCKESKENMRIKRKLGRRKRARYYEQRGDTTESSSEDRPSKVLKRKIPSSRSSRSDKVIMLEMSSHDDTQAGPQEGKQVSDSDDSGETNSGSKDTQSIGKRDLSNKPNTEYDTNVTDPTRSVTPELTNVRMDLANIVKSPQRNVTNDEQFAEDIYFDDDIPKSKDNISNHESQFLIPDVPKGKKISPTTKSVEDSLKSVLEDIISESERYSSDDASENDFGNKRQQKSPYKCVDKDNQNVPDRDPKYQPSYTLTKPLDLPLPKFAEQKNVAYFEMSRNTSLQGCSRSMSSAMRRIYESMTSRSKGSDGESGLEYVPTKINPAMAKRNHQLFDNDITVDSVHDIFSDNSTFAADGQYSGIPAIDSCTTFIDKESEKKSANVFKIQMFEDYVPDDDALYRDGSSDGLSDKNEDPTIKVSSVANIPMPNEENRQVTVDANKDEAPVIQRKSCDASDTNPQSNKLNSGNVQADDPTMSIAIEQCEDTNETPKTDVNPLASLLNINFSNINAEILAKALKDIQALATVAQENNPIDKIVEDDNSNEECVEINNQDPSKDTTIIVDDSDEPKPANIPFLSDMFDPGTPPSTQVDKPDTQQPTEKLTDLSNIQEPNLDDLLDLPPIRPVGGFKSFAIPKPIMLNRLKCMNPSNEQNKEANTKTVGKKKKKAKGDESGGPQDEEEDEESGDEEDLSKYDLWGSDEEPNNKDKPETSTSNTCNTNTNTETTGSKASPSPQNNDDKRSRSLKKSSGSTSRSSSSSSSSSESSSGPVPRNRFDDFNLNSELSRAESADSSRSRSNSRDRKHSSSRTDKKHKSSSLDHGRDRKDRHSRSHRSGRDRHRKESDRRHHNSYRLRR